MRKLTLKLESLEVQSFATGDATHGVGTVRANLDAAVASPVPVPQGDTDCVATYDPCTCVPIETCSCGPDTPASGDCWR